MSILIKGVEMPTKQTTFTIFPNGYVAIYDAKDSFIGETKAVHVPPHGRLIDADAYESLLLGIGNREYRRENGTICDAIKFLHPHYAPTIIEAEEEPNGRA